MELAAAELVLGFVGSEQLPAVAVRAMESGRDSPSLRQLAGLTAAETDEARPLFEKALAELGSSLPTVAEAVLVVARQTAQDILAGETSPDRGAKRIWRAALELPDEIPLELHTFIYGASEWDERPEDRPLFAEGIVEAAKALVD